MLYCIQLKESKHEFPLFKCVTYSESPWKCCVNAQSDCGIMWPPKEPGIWPEALLVQGRNVTDGHAARTQKVTLRVKRVRN